MQGDMALFEKAVLAGGVLESMGNDGFVCWGEWLRDVKVGYWELFH